VVKLRSCDPGHRRAAANRLSRSTAAAARRSVLLELRGAHRHRVPGPPTTRCVAHRRRRNSCRAYGSGAPLRLVFRRAGHHSFRTLPCAASRRSTLRSHGSGVAVLLRHRRDDDAGCAADGRVVGRSLLFPWRAGHGRPSRLLARRWCCDGRGTAVQVYHRTPRTRCARLRLIRPALEALAHTLGTVCRRCNRAHTVRAGDRMELRARLGVVHVPGMGSIRHGIDSASHRSACTCC
jgi:hypothetical protein